MEAEQQELVDRIGEAAVFVLIELGWFDPEPVCPVCGTECRECVPS